MATAAAASAHCRAIRRRKFEAEQQRAREVRKIRSEWAREAFDNLSSDDGLTIPEILLEEFLTRVVKVDKEKLNKDAVRFVLNTAQRKQKVEQGGGEEMSSDQYKNSPSCPNQYRNAVLHRKALVSSYERYDEYMNRLPEINDMYIKFDKDHDGYLSRKELRNALQDLEREIHRSRNGIVVRLVVLDEDIDYVMEQSDTDGDGRIGRHEYLPAVEAWDELAVKKLTQKRLCCTIL